MDIKALKKEFLNIIYIWYNIRKMEENLCFY